MSDTQHVLDAIDGALLDYTVSDDAMRWTPEPPVKTPRTGLFQSSSTPTLYFAPLNIPAPEDIGRAFTRTVDSFAEALCRAFSGIERMGQAMRDAAITMRELPALIGDEEDQPHTDARARALWLRQHRNTGPSRDLTRQRRPRIAQ